MKGALSGTFDLTTCAPTIHGSQTTSLAISIFPSHFFFLALRETIDV